MIKTNAIRIFSHGLIGIFIFAGLALPPAQPALAAGYTVNSLADTDDGVCNATNCTLREAINAANDTYAADTIQFSVSGTISLSTVLPGIEYEAVG